MQTTHEAYNELITTLREIGTLSSVAGVLGWDERTYMPPKGAELRSRQSALLARMIHQQFTAPRIGELLGRIEASDLVRDPESDAAANVRETRRSYDRATKLPSTLVEELARTTVLAEHAWVEARRKSCFADFAPWLSKVLDLKKQEASCLGYKEHPYDALLDDYEPGETAANIAFSSRCADPWSI
jgi:carboxypeptidase Taq